MKFIVTKTKPGMFTDEYDVQLDDKTKSRLRTAVAGLVILAPAAYFVKNGTSSTTKNDPETIES